MTIKSNQPLIWEMRCVRICRYYELLTRLYWFVYHDLCLLLSPLIVKTYSVWGWGWGGWNGGNKYGDGCESHLHCGVPCLISSSHNVLFMFGCIINLSLHVANKSRLFGYPCSYGSCTFSSATLVFVYLSADDAALILSFFLKCLVITAVSDFSLCSVRSYFHWTTHNFLYFVLL